MNLRQIIESQKEFFYDNYTKDIGYRRSCLENLLQAITDNEPAIYAALSADLGRSEAESYMTEVSVVTREIRFILKNLEKWTRLEKVRTPMRLWPAKSYILKEPHGVVLIMSPWNNPFLLNMLPLVAALAAGNCIILKPSKNSPNTTQVISGIIGSTLDRRLVHVIDEQLTYDEILRQPYDYIFFTGSQRVGKLVMRTAAEKLIPVTLELGGKNPCIIHESADIDLAAKRIVWAKIINSGQSCVAPDYVAVHSSIKDKFVERVKEYKLKMVRDFEDNPDYPSIINLHHYIRLKNIIDKERDVIGGRFLDEMRRIELCIFPNASWDSLVMRDEIFGPILPIIGYDDIREVIPEIKQRSKPLACYIFATDNGFIQNIIADLSFGGGCINDCMMHLTNENLPFGGVGTSGMGKYHGKAGFDTFSNAKSIMGTTKSADNDLRYPPFTEDKYKSMRDSLK